MGSDITGISAQLNLGAQTTQTAARTENKGIAIPGDQLSIGGNGPLTARQTIEIVTERAMAKLQSVVGEARAALGLPESQSLDLSAEATAGRIVDFALNFFENFRANNKEMGDDARQAFIDLIGPAIKQGIDEARGILGALQALTPDADNKINDIDAIIQQRLDTFLQGA